MNQPSVKRLLLTALVVAALDQLSKRAVLLLLHEMEERTVVDGFFKFVHWGNTGAAWSLFRDNNKSLAIVSMIALVALFFARRHFDNGTRLGQTALGLMIGGIVGNLFDRIGLWNALGAWLYEGKGLAESFTESLRSGHVVDFLYFHVYTRSGEEVGFPAFNIADSAICVGVGILFLLSWRQQPGAPMPTPAASETAPADPANPPNPS